MLSSMTDEQLIAYCENYCKVENALLHAYEISRMVKLAGGCASLVERWISVRKDLEETCRLARERLDKADKPKPHLTLVKE